MTAENRKEPIERQARYWFVRLGSGDISGGDREAFEAWKAEDPLHGEAFAYLAAIDVVAEEQAHKLQGASIHAVSVGSHRAGRAAAIAASLILLVVAGMFFPFWRDGAMDVYATEIGELREISLADGSRVHLSGDTKVTVTYSQTQRRLVLSQGQALFTVEHDPSRPFFVDAHGTVIRALGTQFDVHRRPRGVTVSVLDGSVTVSRPKREEGEGLEPSPRPLIVEKGQRVAYGPPDGTVPPTAEITASQPERFATWRQGLLEFNLSDLETVVADVNRHAKGRLVLSDDTLRGLPVTAVFRVGDFEEVAEALEQILPIVASATRPGEIVLMPRN